jgi:hypothetical protein
MNFYKKAFIFWNFLNFISFYFCYNTGELETKLNYPHYEYKRSSKFEHNFQKNIDKCQAETECLKLESYVLQNCILKCLSKKCYEEIYLADPLEEGEIDQRLNSFKGCYLQDNK